MSVAAAHEPFPEIRNLRGIEAILQALNKIDHLSSRAAQWPRRDLIEIIIESAIVNVFVQIIDKEQQRAFKQ